EDMNKILSDYLVTMSDAIRFRETVNQFRRIGLVAPEESLIDISATLSSVTGRLSPVTVTALREMGENGATRATSRLVDVKIGGRTFRIPSTVKASPRFGQVAKKLSKALSTVDRRGRELTLAIERNA